MSNPRHTQTTFTASKFRSPEAARLLRAQAAEHSDFNLSKWTTQAIKDMAEFAHLKGTTNGNERRTWCKAVRAVREGVELFARTFWPSCATMEGRIDPNNRSDAALYYEFTQTRYKDIIDMAVLEANAE